MALKDGAIRFNTDSSQMEIYVANEWIGMSASSGEMLTGGTRAFFAGGTNGGSNRIDYVNVDTTGDAIDFGDLTTTRWICKGTCLLYTSDAADE